jgi:phosphonate transport system substrate-binding protein
MSDESQAPFSLGRVLLVAIPVALVTYVGVSRYSGELRQEAKEQQIQTTISRMLGRADESATLAARYQDANNDLVADPPTDPLKLLDPDEIVFSYVASTEPSDDPAVWQPLADAIAERVKRPVRYERYSDTGEQLRALRDGQLHVTAFATGAAPHAVNESGFVPVACLADAEGKYSYTMKIIVPADSPIETVEQLRGKRMTFTRPRSNSGYKAALALLLMEYDMRPERDYSWGFSYGHEASILGVANQEFQAAAVASDLLEGMIAGGQVDPAKVRTIYESDPFPPGVFGYGSQLTAELSAGIRAALLELDLTDTEIQKRFGGGKGGTRLAGVNYREDWEPVRRINQAVRDARAEADAYLR